KIYPLIKSAIPNVKFYVVGNYPPRSIKRLLSNGDIVVTGHVEDVRPYFDRSAVFVCPLRSGSGMQAKILEAMAMGVPVVTTSMGATAIVDAVAGKDILIANDVKSFAKEVIRLLKDKDLRCNIAQNARKLVEEKYNWGFIVNDINEMYQSITGRSNSPY
ncbi:MAG: glycosyltransferase, partial [bacterium]